MTYYPNNSKNPSNPQGSSGKSTSFIEKAVSEKEASTDLVRKLVEEVREMKASMNRELELVKDRLYQCERENQRLSQTIARVIDSTTTAVKTNNYESIGEEFKSTKRDINE